MFPIGWWASGPYMGNLWAWYRAQSLGLSDGATIASATDLSGNGRHATQSTEANKPLYKAAIRNGRAVMRFDGTNDKLSVATLLGDSSGAALSMFVVCKQNAAAANTILSIRPSSGNRGWQWRYNSGAARHEYFHTGETPGVSENFTTTNWSLLKIVRNGLSVQLGRNNALGSSVAQSGYTVTTETVLSIGALASSVYLAGDIAEILLYNTNLTTAQRQQTEVYLNTEYALY